MKKLFFALFAILICKSTMAQSIGMGTLTPDSSAQLDITSNSKGVLVPRLNEGQKSNITSPAVGLLIFNVSLGCFQYYDGTIWQSIIGSSSNYWNKNGTHITNTNTGNVGIGVVNPTARLTVDSSIMVDQANSNQGSLDRSSLYFGSDKSTGIIRSYLNGSSGRNGLGFFTNDTRRLTIDSTGKIGIGTINPLQTLHVNGRSYFAENMGVGTVAPDVRLSVDSSIMVDQSNSNQGFLDRSSLYFGSDKSTGIIRSYLNGSSGRNGLGFFTKGTRRVTIDSTGQVGIGTINPLQTLHVNGPSYFVGNLGIGSSTPDYAFENQFGYNYMLYGLGIGTVPSSSYLLDVANTNSGVRFRGDTRVDGTLNPTTNLNIGSSATVKGSLTVNNGKGVAYNASNSTNLRIYTFTTATFNAVLPGFGLSAEGAIAFNGGFTGVPRVFVGDIDVTGGTSGELYRVQLQLYGCSTTNGVTTCKARLLNTSPNPVNYSITWNCMAIGN